MKKFIAILLVLTMMLGLTACGECDHDWEKATCEDPKTCSKCGETKGDPEEDHDWEEDDDGKMVCSWCGEEKEEDEDEDEDKNEDEGGSAQAPDAPTTPGGISWYCTATKGLTYYVPEDARIFADSPDYVILQSEIMSIGVGNGYLGGVASSDQEFAQVHMDEITYGYQSIEMGKANGTPYVFISYEDGTYEVRGFYYYASYGWIISVVVTDWNSYGDAAIRCATTGEIDETIADQYIDQSESAEDTFTVHAYVPLAWGYPSCWAWSSSTGENVFDEWPGEEMYWAGDHFTIEIPIWADYVIVNGLEGSLQTADEPVEPGCDIWIVVYPEGDMYGVSYTEPTAEELADAGF